MLNPIIETEKYWKVKIKAEKFPKSKVTSAIIWKSRPNKMIVSTQFAGDKGWKEDNVYSFSIRGGSLNLFSVSQGRSANIHFRSDFAPNWDLKAFQSFCKFFNFFLKSNRRETFKIKEILEEYRKENKLEKERSKEIERNQKNRSYWGRNEKSAVQLYKQWQNYFFTRKVSFLIGEQVYPGLKVAPSIIQSPFARIFKDKNLTLEKFVYKLTGNNGRKTRKLIIEGVRNRPYDAAKLSWIYLFKNLVPIEDIQGFILDQKSRGWSGSTENIRKFLKLLPDNMRRKTFKRDGIDYNCFLSDTVSQWSKLNCPEIPKTCKNLREIHDWTSIEYLKIKNAPKEISWKDEYLEIDNAKIQDLRIELPKDSHYLVDYGTKLSHCVASYGEMAAKGNCQILAIYKNEELKYNLEIRNKLLIQFRGKRNCEPDEDDKNLILSYLCDRNLIKYNNNERTFHANPNN